MIRFRGTKDGAELIGLGFSKDELTRLLAGQKILIRLAQLGLPEGEMLVFAGENEAEMHRNMEKIIGKHVFAPDAHVLVDPLTPTKDLTS